ncbi:MAG: T9SS type A sorting domain-containing protein [Fidelibacterota bacterium]
MNRYIYIWILFSLFIIKAQGLSELSTINTNSTVYSIEAKNENLFLTEYHESYSIFKSFDISNPSNPIFLDSISTSGFIVNFTLSDTLAYFAMADSEFGIRIVDISDPSNLEEIIFIEGTESNGVYYQQGKLYIANGGGLVVYNIISPDSLSLDWYYPTNQYGDAFRVYVDSAKIYVSVISYGVMIFDKSSQSLLYSIESSDLLSGLKSNDSILFISDQINGFSAYDISNYISPILLDSISCSSNSVLSGQILLDTNYAYLADGNVGLKMIKIDNPVQMELSSVYSINNSTSFSVSKNDSIIFLGCNDKVILLQQSELSIGDSHIIKRFNIESVYPNPFNPKVNINYYIENDSYVEISIFNINGQHIKSINNSLEKSGKHSLEWRPLNFSSGIYIVVFNVDDMKMSTKVLLLK